MGFVMNLSRVWAYQPSAQQGLADLMAQAVDAASFTMAVAWAGLDAGRELQIVRRLGQGSDHPVLASFPESEYLKGLLVRTA